MIAPRPVRTAIALILLGVLAVVCVSAGFWQLRRAAERTTLAQAIDAGRKAPPVTLSVAQPDGEDWHNAKATGTWRHDFTVLLDNRNLKGQPGLWVATPLQLRDDPDPETGERYTVKRYESEKSVSEDGTWRHIKVTLKPNNPAYSPIVLTCEDEGSVRVIAEVLEVLK